MRVHVEMKDGKLRKFPDSYAALYAADYVNVKYEGAFVIIHEQGKRTAIPAADVREVKEFRDRY
jgi:hypothetical protein